MPNIPISSPLNYIGIFLLIVGLFLVLSGFHIIKIEKVTVMPGRKTWGVGLVMLALGIIFLLPEITEARLLPATAPTGAVPGSTLVPTRSGETGEADLSIYDDFDNPYYETSYDRSKWDLEGASSEQAVQQDGIMVLRQESATSSYPNTRLYTREYQNAPIENPMAFETRMKLSPEEHDGAVGFQVLFTLQSGESWEAGCTIVGEPVWKFCWESALWSEGNLYETELEPTDWGKWHTFRIEIYPDTMTFRYYVDGELKGTHIPPDAEILKDAAFVVTIDIYGNIPSTGALSGSFEYVRIGNIDE